MTRNFKLTDGTISVEVAAWTATGYSAQRGGLGPNSINYDMAIQTSRKLGLNSLSEFSSQPVIEKWVLNLREASQVAVGTQLTTMILLLRKAMRYHSPEYHADTDPVYIERKPTNGVTEYSLVTGCLELQYPDLFKTPFEVDNELEGIVVAIVREPFWRTKVPGEVPADSTELSNREDTNIQDWMPVGNSIGGTGITHVFVHDVSVGFSANQVINADFDLLPAAPAVGDILYIGSENNVFHTAIMELSSMFEGTNVAGVWEDWTGAWVARTGAAYSWPDGIFNDPTYQLGAGIPLDDKPSGMGALRCCLSLYSQDAWALKGVNGVNAYWIRFRVTAATGVTSVPHHFSDEGHGVRIANSDYVKMDADEYTGDSPGLIRIKMKSQAGYDANAGWINRVTIGAKSRGVADFVSKITLGTSPSGDWVLTVGTDTSIGANAGWATKRRTARCTFATTITNAVRLSGEIQDDPAADGYRGTYQVKLVVSQTGGSAGDVEVKIGFNTMGRDDPATWESEFMATLSAGGAVAGESEVLDMGLLKIPGGDADPTDVITNLSFNISAKSVSSTPFLYIQDLWLIPVDEFSVVLEDPVIPFNAHPPISRLDDYSNGGTLVGVKYLEYDTGIVQPWPRAWLTGVFNRTPPATSESVIMNWLLRGEPQGVEVTFTDMRFFFFFEAMKQATAGSDMALPWTSPPYLNAMVLVWDNSRSQGIKGAL